MTKTYTRELTLAVPECLTDEDVKAMDNCLADKIWAEIQRGAGELWVYQCVYDGLACGYIIHLGRHIIDTCSGYVHSTWDKDEEEESEACGSTREIRPCDKENYERLARHWLFWDCESYVHEWMGMKVEE